jgi:hypothetical protein
LDAEAADPEHLVVIGGSALIALGLVSRTATRDVDVMADVDPVKGWVDPRPLSDALQRTVHKVAEELDLGRKPRPCIRTSPNSRFGIPMNIFWNMAS